MSLLPCQFRCLTILALSLLFVACGGSSQGRSTAAAPKATVETPAANSIVRASPTLVSGKLSDASIEPEPNQYGWNNTDVTVTFTAEDELSGIDTVTAPVTLTEEGENQEVVGEATDRAGNTTTIGVKLNIDKAPPVITGLPEDCSLWAPNHKLVQVADVLITDSLSGVDTSSIDAVSSEPDSGPGYGNATPDVVITGNVIELRAERYSPEGRTYDLAVVATDRAGNVAEGNAVCIVVHDQGNQAGNKRGSCALPLAVASPYGQHRYSLLVSSLRP